MNIFVILVKFYITYVIFIEIGEYLPSGEHLTVLPGAGEDLVQNYRILQWLIYLPYY